MLMLKSCLEMGGSMLQYYVPQGFRFMYQIAESKGLSWEQKGSRTEESKIVPARNQRAGRCTAASWSWWAEGKRKRNAQICNRSNQPCLDFQVPANLQSKQSLYCSALSAVPIKRREIHQCMYHWTLCLLPIIALQIPKKKKWNSAHRSSRIFEFCSQFMLESKHIF